MPGVFREVKQPAWVCIAGKKQSWDLNLCLPDPTLPIG